MTIAGQRREAVFEEAIVATRRAFIGASDTRVIDRPGWLQLITPSMMHGVLNEVVHSELDDGEAEAIIDRTIAEYGELRFRWRVDPDPRPTDMRERLRRRGFVEHPTLALAKSIEIEGPSDERIRVEIVDETNVELFSRMIGEGWNMPIPPLDRFHRHILGSPNRRHHMFIAFDGDECAGAANMVLLERSMLLQGGVVLPQFRGRGIYRALVDVRMRFAAARGYTLATTHANPETSAPILLRNGFEEICAFSKFFNR